MSGTTQSATTNNGGSQGGGGNAQGLTKDVCPNGDLSPSYYDNSCAQPNGTAPSEIGQAYDFALENELTKLFPMDAARAYDPIVRYEAAIVLSKFAISILKRTPDTSRNCTFTDVANLPSEDREFTKIACQLGIMGLKANGQPSTVFKPSYKLSREMFLVTLSRLLYGTIYNTQPGESDSMRSTHHIKKLKDENIVTQTDANKLKTVEIR